MENKNTIIVVGVIVILILIFFFVNKNNSIKRSNSIKNTMPCCSRCNFMKSYLGVEEFIAHVAKIYKFQNNKNAK